MVYGGVNRIYRLDVIIPNRLFAECEVLDNLWFQDPNKDKVFRSEDNDKDL